jgi:flagellar biosynthesis protein FliP
MTATKETSIHLKHPYKEKKEEEDTEEEDENVEQETEEELLFRKFMFANDKDNDDEAENDEEEEEEEEEEEYSEFEALMTTFFMEPKKNRNVVDVLLEIKRSLETHNKIMLKMCNHMTTLTPRPT